MFQIFQKHIVENVDAIVMMNHLILFVHQMETHTEIFVRLNALDSKSKEKEHAQGNVIVEMHSNTVVVLMEEHTIHLV